MIKPWIRDVFRVALWAVLLVPGLPVPAESDMGDLVLSGAASQYLSKETLRELREKGKVFARPEDAEDLSLVPPDFRSSFEADMEEINPNVISEALLWVPSDHPHKDLVYLFNQFLQVDRLDEIQYVNLDSGNPHPIFHESYRVPQVDSRKRLPNIQRDSIPRELSFYVYQVLPPVGPMTSEYAFRNRGNVLEMTARNVTPLKKSFLSVISKGNFYTRVLLYPTEQGFLLYGVGAVKVFNPFNILGGKLEPFYYRIYGLFEWYQEEIVRPMLDRDDRPAEGE